MWAEWEGKVDKRIEGDMVKVHDICMQLLDNHYI